MFLTSPYIDQAITRSIQRDFECYGDFATVTSVPMFGAPDGTPDDGVLTFRSLLSVRGGVKAL